MTVLQESRILRLLGILEAAPDFEAKFRQGVIRLGDYTAKGKYVLLFSHPTEFTPVCFIEICS
jgi:peroxiredoxin (alkyl hydroperoxide reductase subunit C)